MVRVMWCGGLGARVGYGWMTTSLCPGFGPFAGVLLCGGGAERSSIKHENEPHVCITHDQHADHMKKNGLYSVSDALCCGQMVRYQASSVGNRGFSVFGGSKRPTFHNANPTSPSKTNTKRNALKLASTHHTTHHPNAKRHFIVNRLLPLTPQSVTPTHNPNIHPHTFLPYPILPTLPYPLP
eukprot:732922-Amorphochlora_amoeboformis.AAC.1